MRKSFRTLSQASQIQDQSPDLLPFHVEKSNPGA